MNTEQQTPPPITPSPSTQPPKPKRKLGCLAWLGIIVGGFILLAIIGGIMSGPSTPSGNTTDTGTNSVFEAGAWVGAVDGMAAYNRGDTYPTDDEFDAKGRRATADTKFDKPEDRQEWINGYKAGFKIGWDKEKDGK
jgi:hypothetical protein